MNKTAASRRTILVIIEPLLEAIEKRRAELENEVLEAYEATGFDDPNLYEFDDDSPEAITASNGWEILPHQYVWSKLHTFLEQPSDALLRAIEDHSIDNVKTSLGAIQEAANLTFTEVEEFLKSPLSRMKKDEWEKQPSWGDWVNSNALPNWKIGVVSMIENPPPLTPEEEEAIEEWNAIHN